MEGRGPVFQESPFKIKHIIGRVFKPRPPIARQQRMHGLSLPKTFSRRRSFFSFKSSSPQLTLPLTNLLHLGLLSIFRKPSYPSNYLCIFLPIFPQILVIFSSWPFFSPPFSIIFSSISNLLFVCKFHFFLIYLYKL